MTTKPCITKGSPNVFADLGIAEPETALAKAELARHINAILKQRRLTQTRAAEILGVDQAKISALSHGNLTGLSTERLFRFLNALGRDIQIPVQPKPARRKQARVTVIPQSPATSRSAKTG